MPRDTITNNPTEVTTQAADSRFLPQQFDFLERLVNPLLDSVTGAGVKAITQKLGVAPASRDERLPERDAQGGLVPGAAGPVDPDNIPKSVAAANADKKGFTAQMEALPLAAKVGMGAGALLLMALIIKKL